MTCNSEYLLVHKDYPLNPGGINSGAETATLCLAHAIANLGRKVVVAGQICAPASGNPTKESSVEFWDLGSDYDVDTVLRRMAKRGPFHLLSACRALPLIAAKSISNCRSRHLIAHDPSAGALGLKPQILARQIDGIICVSKAQSQLFTAEGVDSAKITVIPNGADTKLFTPGNPSSRDPYKLIYFGALVVDKGIDILIKVYLALRGKYPRLTLDVYGSSEMWGRAPLFDYNKLEAECSGLKFHGAVAQPVVAKALREAGLCVIPSRWFDSFPLSAVEAQAAGCPVVGFDVGGIREAVKHGETGMLISEVSETALEQTLDTLLADSSRLEKMSEKAATWAQTNFSWDRAAHEVIHLCEKTTAKQTLNSTADVVQKKLGFFTTWNQECGLATYAKYLLNEFEPGSYVVFSEKDTVTTAADEPFVERVWTRTTTDWSALEQAIKRHDIGLLHLNFHDHTFVNHPSFHQFLNRIKGAGIRIVAHQHTTFTFHPDFRAFAELLDGIIVHSSENRLQVLANGGKEVWVVPHGIHRSSPMDSNQRNAWRAKYGVAAHEKILVSFGFVQPNKGMEGLIEAVAHLQHRGIGAKGFIVGRPNAAHPESAQYAAKLQELVVRSGLENHVKFISEFVSNDQLIDFLRVADLVIMNYQSQYYEASGASVLALGAGALVATSCSPTFSGLGEAVWHMTSGFRPGLSAEILLTNDELRAAILNNANQFCDKHAWPQIALSLNQIYSDLSFKPTVTKEYSVEQKSRTASDDSLRVLFQNRPNTFTQRGGDTVVMEKLGEGLKAYGIKVTVDLDGTNDPRNFDLVHLFNFALPDMLKSWAMRAEQAGVPYIVTTLCEDVGNFHETSLAWARVLVEYVRRGHDKAFFEANKPGEVPQRSGFDNAWTAAHATALITNGAQESALIRRLYPSSNGISEIKFGSEVGAQGRAEDFVREYGISDFVFCVGRLESRKNQLMLLKALEQVDLPIVFAAGGFSYQPDYEQAVRAFRRNAKTVVLDRIDPQMLSAAYQACRVHVLPSWYELPGLVSIEAASLGKNVVATRQGTLVDYLGDKAFYCDPSCEDSIRNAVLAAYYSPAVPGLKELAQSFTWSKFVEDTVAVYQRSVKKSVRIPMENITINPVTGPNEPSNDELLTQAEDLARARDFNRSQELLAQLEARDPKSIRILRSRGAVYLAQGNAEKAKQYFERALAADPRDVKVNRGLGMCEIMNGNLSGAYSYFVQALELDGSDLMAMRQLIECSYSIGRFDDLERLLRRYVALHSEDMEMAYCHAGALFKLGRISEASIVVDRVLSINPNHLGAKQLRDFIMEKEAHRSPLAQKVEVTNTPPPQVFVSKPLGQFIKPPPKEEPIVTEPTPRLGSYSDFDDIDRKLIELDEAKRRKNFDVVMNGSLEILNRPSVKPHQRERATLLKAEIALLQNNIAEAEKIYDEVLAENPNSARALSGKGVLQAHLGRWEEARRFFERAIALEPRYDMALAGLGMCHSYAKDADRAWSYYKQAVAVNPENVRALLGIIELGYPLRRLAEVEQAIKSYLEIHPADLNFVYSLAGCCFAQDKLSEATEAIERIILFDPGHRKALELKNMIDARATHP